MCVCFRSVDHEIPQRIMRGGGLGYLVVLFRFNCVDEVRELYCVLDEKYGDVVAD